MAKYFEPETTGLEVVKEFSSRIEGKTCELNFLFKKHLSVPNDQYQLSSPAREKMG